MVKKSIKQKGKKSSSSTKEDYEIIWGLKNLTLLLTSLEKSNVSKPSLKKFIRPSKRPLVEHDDLSSQRANSFDPNTYKFLVRVGYKKKDVINLTHK